MLGDIVVARWVLILALTGVGLAPPVTNGADPGAPAAFDVMPPGPLPSPDRPEQTHFGASWANLDEPGSPIPPVAQLLRPLDVSRGSSPGVRARIDRPPRRSPLVSS